MADALLTVLDDVLDFSRIEAGRLALAEEPFDRCTTVEVVDLLAARAQEKGIELICRYAPGRPRGVGGDPLRV